VLLCGRFVGVMYFILYSSNMHFMSYKFSLIVLLCLLLSACLYQQPSSDSHSKSEQSSSVQPPSAQQTPPMNEPLTVHDTAARATVSDLVNDFVSDSLTGYYVMVEGRDTHFVKLIIAGKQVTGLMSWEPYQSDGARGSLTGIMKDSIVTAVFLYMIEGSVQEEEKMFVKRGKTLVEAVGPLKEVRKVLILKDKTKLKFTKVYQPIEPARSLGLENRALMVIKEIKESSKKK
jgi:hypothetical protein